MFTNNRSNKSFKILVKLRRQRSIVAKLWEFSIYSSNNFDIIMLDELQILFLIFFRTSSEIRIQLLMQFAVLILFPICQLEMILSFITKQSHNFKQHFEQCKYKHTSGVIFKMKGINILNSIIKMSHILQLKT